MTKIVCFDLSHLSEGGHSKNTDSLRDRRDSLWTTLDTPEILGETLCGPSLGLSDWALQGPRRDSVWASKPGEETGRDTVRGGGAWLT